MWGDCANSHQYAPRKGSVIGRTLKTSGICDIGERLLARAYLVTQWPFQINPWPPLCNLWVVS